jgi:putative transposase
MIENFNDRYQQMFLGKVVMSSQEDLKAGSLVFEQRHNSRYRYSKLGGKTPLKALAAMNIKLRFPVEDKAPKHRLKKPETGKYHLVRLIRRDLKLNVFGEIFRVSPELQLEYVVATINVKEQKLKLFLDKTQVDEFRYKLR